MNPVNAFLNFIERAGNRLPDPVSLFALLVGLVLLASFIASTAGVVVQNPATGEAIPAVNLLSGDAIRTWLIEMAAIFAGFHPLGVVLLVMLGVGVAERTGFISVGLSVFVRALPNALLTAGVVFAGIMSSLAADAGYVVLIPLGAVLFQAAGRHPLAGLAAAFAGVSGGFSANLVPTGLDPLLAGLTQEAAQLTRPGYVVEATANYYLMIGLVPVFTLVGTWVTWAFVESRLEPVDEDAQLPADAGEITPEQRRGLAWAGYAFLAMIVLLALAVFVPGAPLHDGPGSSRISVVAAIVTLMFILFLVVGLAYGIAAKQIRTDKDAVKMMSASMSDMGGYIVLAFAASQFIYLFGESNLGAILAISGAAGLKAIGFVGWPLLIAIVVLVCLLNLFVGSASAKWAIMAPILVPLLIELGVSPELTQAVYRIGDSATNMITPLLPYFPLIIVFAQRYQRSFGIGSLVALMLPYSVFFGAVSTLFLILWVTIGLPLGPGVESFINPAP